MKRCEKCGSKKIHGPSYDFLAYLCFSCGHIKPVHPKLGVVVYEGEEEEEEEDEEEED